MENTEHPFNFQILIPSSTKYIVKVKGAYRRGNLTPEQKKDIETAISKGILLTNNGVLLIFDLLELTYWDTLGINTIVEAIKTVNKKHIERAGMILKRNSLAFIAASTRHSQEFNSGRILCGETEEELLSTRS